MKYLAALTIGIGLMSRSPAFAEVFNFGPRNDAPMRECLKAAEKGFELSELEDGLPGTQRFLVKDIKMGTSWRVYQISTFKGPGTFQVSCTYSSLKSRTT